MTMYDHNMTIILLYIYYEGNIIHSLYDQNMTIDDDDDQIMAIYDQI